jgi:hypothetical protein
MYMLCELICSQAVSMPKKSKKSQTGQVWEAVNLPAVTQDDNFEEHLLPGGHCTDFGLEEGQRVTVISMRMISWVCVTVKATVH